MENSKIEWTDNTGNLWIGCAKVHTGCKNCYAEAQSKRWNRSHWGDHEPRLQVKGIWENLRNWNAKAVALGVKKTVFVGSLMDIFEMPKNVVDGNRNPVLIDGTEVTTESIRQHFFKTVVPQSPGLIFLLLTKRPQLIPHFIPAEWVLSPPPNVWYGTSISNHETAIPLIHALKTIRGNKFLSIEPQVGPIDLLLAGYDLQKPVQWIIQGGESGPNRRPFNLEWAYHMKSQCRDFGIPYFFKQIDKVQEIPDDLLVREFPGFELKQ